MQELSKLDQHFQILTKDDYNIVYDYIKKYPSENCDFNMNTLFSWGQYFKLEYTIFQERLLLFNPFYGYLLAPIGEKFSAQELYQINNCCEKIHKKVEIMVVSEKYINTTPELSEYFTIYNDIDWNDYIYSVDDLVNLSGKKLAKKKNLISQFVRNYPNWTVKQIQKEDINDIVEFSNYWKKTHTEVTTTTSKETDNDYLAIELQALQISLQNWDFLPNDGIKLYIDNKLVAFAIFSQQTDDMVTIHFEKYDPFIKGAGQMINYQSAIFFKDKFKYINREQDMGIEGIRQAKRSYQPIKLLPFYRLKSK